LDTSDTSDSLDLSDISILIEDLFGSFLSV
jgi:hypothetical protein